MKRASVESKVLYLPDEAYTEKGYYDSDGPDSIDNLKDDTYDAALEDSFEYYENEGKASENIKIGQENLKKIKAFQSKLGKSAVDAIGLLDKIAA